MTDTMEPEVYVPTAQDLADGLRKLAEFVERHPDGPKPIVYLSVGYGANGPIKLAQVLEASTDYAAEQTTYGLRVQAKFGLLPVILTGPESLWGEEKTLTKTVTEVVPATRDELIVRGHAAQRVLIEEPF